MRCQVVDSHIQRRIVLATEETTVTQQVSHRPLSNANPACSHKGVLRSTGHIMVTTRYSDQIATKSYATLQALAPTNVKTVLVFAAHDPTYQVNILTFFSPDWGMLRRSKCVHIFLEKPPYSISRATSIDSDCRRLPTTSVLSDKAGKLPSNQFRSTSPSFSRLHIVQK